MVLTEPIQEGKMKIDLEEKTSKVVAELAMKLSRSMSEVMIRSVGLYYLLFKRGLMDKSSSKVLYIYDTETKETIEVENI